MNAITTFLPVATKEFTDFTNVESSLEIGTTTVVASDFSTDDILLVTWKLLQSSQVFMKLLLLLLGLKITTLFISFNGKIELAFLNTVIDAARNLLINAIVLGVSILPSKPVDSMCVGAKALRIYLYLNIFLHFSLICDCFNSPSEIAFSTE